MRWTTSKIVAKLDSKLLLLPIIGSPDFHLDSLPGIYCQSRVPPKCLQTHCFRILVHKLYRCSLFYIFQSKSCSQNRLFCYHVHLMHMHTHPMCPMSPNGAQEIQIQEAWRAPAWSQTSSSVNILFLILLYIVSNTLQAGRKSNVSGSLCAFLHFCSECH